MKRFMLHIVLLSSVLCFFSGVVYANQSKGIRPSIAVIAKEMADYQVYESQRVGFAGAYSSQYKRYEKLLAEATVQELFLLTRQESPVVRVYAYEALTQKSPRLAARAYRTLQKDKAGLNTLNGCIGGEATVGSLVKGVILQQ
jgi:hypothetical protein